MEATATRTGSSEAGTPFSFDGERPGRAAPTGRELLGIFAFWTFLGVLIAAGRLLDPRGPSFQVELSSPLIALSFVEPYLWVLLTPMVFWLSARFSIERGTRLYSVAIYLALGVVLAALVAIAAEAIRQAIFAASSPPFGMGPRRRGGGPPPLWLGARWRTLNNLVIYAAVLGTAQARSYSMRYRARREESARLQAESARLQAQLAEARLDALRKQLDPHFLFNTLHAISSLVERDPRGVRRMISRLSELLRYSIEGSSEQEIPLRQELDLLQRYVDIMQVRFQGRLEVTTRVDEDVLDALVPNLVLQPLVENAIKHGVARLEGVGQIEIAASRPGDGRRVAISVTDNGRAEREPDESSGGVGLRNTIARLEQLYGAEQSFSLERRAEGGAVALVTLPYHRRAETRVQSPVVSSGGGEDG